MTAPARRAQVVYATGRGLSVRRACWLLGVARSALRSAARRAAADARAIGEVRALATCYPRYGYRRIWAVWRRQGWPMNRKRVARLGRLAALTRPRHRRRPRRRLGLSRGVIAARPNHVWAYDFVHDRCADGGALQRLPILDEYSRECLALEVAGRLGAARVRAVLDRLVATYGRPAALRSDNGPECIARVLQPWAADRGIAPVDLDPGKPWQNGVTERVTSRVRDECLNVEGFRTRPEATLVIEQWRRDYNPDRPHRSLGYQTPAEIGASRARSIPVSTPSPDGARAAVPTV